MRDPKKYLQQARELYSDDVEVAAAQHKVYQALISEGKMRRLTAHGPGVYLDQTTGKVVRDAWEAAQALERADLDREVAAARQERIKAYQAEMREAVLTNVSGEVRDERGVLQHIDPGDRALALHLIRSGFEGTLGEAIEANRGASVSLDAAAVGMLGTITTNPLPPEIAGENVAAPSGPTHVRVGKQPTLHSGPKPEPKPAAAPRKQPKLHG